MSALGLSNNKMVTDDGCGWQLPNSKLTAQVSLLGVGVDSHLVLSLHSPDEPGGHH